MNEAELQMLASNTLKSVARNEQIKTYIQGSKELYPLLSRAAQRFVVGETRDQAVSEAFELILKGYSVSMEYIGENTRILQECVSVKNEFLQLVRTVGQARFKSTISLDLSHIGLTVNPELAYEHLLELAREADLHGIEIMISAEESAKTDQILEIYKRVSEIISNVGITLQAHLHRTERDCSDIKHYAGRIRIVKGAYQESEDIALPRSEELNERYLLLTEMLITTGRPLSIATHDEAIIEEVRIRGYLDQPNVKVEMLYGIRPDLLRKLKDRGYRTKVYLLYGEEWYLYFCHRLAEFPPNIYRAIGDMATPYSAKESLY